MTGRVHAPILRRRNEQTLSWRYFARPIVLTILASALITVMLVPCVGARGAGNKIERISVEELKEWIADGETFVLVDVRNGGTSDRIPDAIHVPLSRMDWWAGTLEDRDQRIVTYCACSADQSSMRAAKKLEQLGFTNVFVLRGGLKAWRKASDGEQE